jgi:hypothetical protein
MSMKCVVCGERKGKRACPAKRALICAQCCGEKRVLEIDCPESCEYLKVGRQREASANYSRHLRPSDPAKAKKYQYVLSNLEDVVSSLEYVIAEERRSSRYLTDKVAAEAVDLFLQTLQTEDKGVLYERTSNNLEVEALRRRLRDAIGSHRAPQEPGRTALKLGDAIACMELIRDVLAGHISSGTATSYVDFLARMLPARARVESGGASIIIPGR